MANSRNVYLTEKQQSRHQQFWRFPWLVADYPGHVTTYFRTQCQRPVHSKELICDIWHSIKIRYPFTKLQSPTPFNSNSHPSHFFTKLRSKTFSVEFENAVQIALDCFVLTLRAVYMNAWIFFFSSGNFRDGVIFIFGPILIFFYKFSADPLLF